MARLSYAEKEIIEKALEMESGYVSDFTNRQFKEFIEDITSIDIYSEKYSSNGDSKAKRLRCFWTIEADDIVGYVLKQLLEREKLRSSGKKLVACAKGLQIANSLLKSMITRTENQQTDEARFLSNDYGILNISEIDINENLKNIINTRLREIELCINNKIHLSAIILIGSTLEGLLLNIAKNDIKNFNKTTSSPKNKEGKTLPLEKWTLANLIDTSYELKYIDKDVKDFSHILRNFRNYIHPNHQLKCNFSPDEYTVKICWQVLRAVVADIIKKNNKKEIKCKD